MSSWRVLDPFWEGKILSSDFWAFRLRQARLKYDPDYRLLVKSEYLLSDSRASLELPFSSDEELYLNYAHSLGGIRSGRLLEDVDALAGNSAFMYIEGGPERMTGATAAFDYMHWFLPMEQSKGDIRMEAVVQFVGRTSVEVQVRVFFQSGDGWEVCGEARIVLVGRTVGGLKPVLPQPTRMSPEELEAFEAGLARYKTRRFQDDEVFPTLDESKLVHSLCMHPASTADPSLVPAFRLKNRRIFHPHHRNQNNDTFGGHLLRESVDLGSAAAMFFFKTASVAFKSMLRFVFVRPVPIGCVVDFVAKAIYSSDLLVVRVDGFLVDGATGSEQPATKCYLIFSAPAAAAASDRAIVPRSFEETMEYIAGQRLLINCAS